MATTATDTTEIGLVLQGGGALGAYEYGAITALARADRRRGRQRSQCHAQGRHRRLDRRHQRGLRGRLGQSPRCAPAACRAVERLRAVDAVLLAGADRARPVALRSAALLRHAARSPGAVELDLSLRYQPAAQDACRACRLRRSEPKRDRLRGHRRRCREGRAQEVLQSAGAARRRRPRSARAMCWRAAACRRNFPGPTSRRGASSAPIGMAVWSTTPRSATPSTPSARARTWSGCW